MSENIQEHTNVFVKFLPPEVDDIQLESIFSEFGTILSVKVMLDKHTGRSLGYGFVRFQQEEEAKKAIERMNGYRIGSKVLLCKISDPFRFPSPSPNLYIKPLPIGISIDEVKELFSKFGQIITVKIVDDAGVISDSTIGYDNIESATQAIESMNGAKIFANLSNLLVQYAESDVQRATRKANSLPPPRYYPSSLPLPRSISKERIKDKENEPYEMKKLSESMDSLDLKGKNKRRYHNNTATPPHIPFPSSSPHSPSSLSSLSSFSSISSSSYFPHYANYAPPTTITYNYLNNPAAFMPGYAPQQYFPYSVAYVAVPVKYFQQDPVE